jgi:2-oxoglutarate ferredoxin oxidoreductase subunit beta
VDILQQCVSFNHVNTFAWYKERCQSLEDDHDPTDWTAAMSRSLEWGDSIPTGILYMDESRTCFEDNRAISELGPLYRKERSLDEVAEVMEAFA